MKIVSWNVNGLRAVAKRDFLSWVRLESPGILCLQEIKLGRAELPAELKDIDGYHSYFNFAEKKGYAGVAVYTKTKPVNVLEQILKSEPCNTEGRTLLVEYDDFAILNIYMPHGGRDKSKLEYKLALYKEVLQFLIAYNAKPLILAGDFNIAHQEIDLARPRQNRHNIMFTAEEREQLDTLLNSKYIDSYRVFHDEPGGYTWWPYMAKARERNIGWRIDYIFVPEALQPLVRRADILSGVLGSDHCPVVAELHAEQLQKKAAPEQQDKAA